MDAQNEILLQKGEGESYWVLGDLYTFKVTGKQTNGAFTIIDQTIQPQGGPPPHVHHLEDEAFYVLDGRFSFLCGEKQSDYSTGSFVYIPRGTVHTFKNIDPQPGRLLVIITPAGLEDFFYAIGTPAANSSAPPPFDPAIMDKILRLANDYKMDIILPENQQP